jgi:hypothetical protein
MRSSRMCSARTAGKFSVGLCILAHSDCASVRFEVNFGQREPYFPPPTGFTFIDHLPLEEKIRGMISPARKADCEVSAL